MYVVSTVQMVVSIMIVQYLPAFRLSLCSCRFKDPLSALCLQCMNVQCRPAVHSLFDFCCNLLDSGLCIWTLGRSQNISYRSLTSNIDMRTFGPFKSRLTRKIRCCFSGTLIPWAITTTASGDGHRCLLLSSPGTWR